MGAGTFLPVKTDNPLQHTMHTEHFEVTAATVRRLAAAAAGRHIVAVGTTSVRTLESLPVLGWRILREGNPHTDTPVGQWEAYDLPAEADGAELLGTLASYMEAAGTEKLQAATQINEMTLSFIPKIIAVFIAIIIAGPWMLNLLLDYVRTLFTNLPYIIG